jgi:hypothetical protein
MSLRETQQAADAATRVASMALDTHGKTNAHVKLALVVAESMLLIKQEGTVASLVSSVSF